MIDIALLKAHGVKSIKLELEFHKEPDVAEYRLDIPNDLHAHEEHQNSVEAMAETIRKQEEALPADLRADALMDQDKILNWSSPDQKPFEEDQPMPLTNEQPL